MMQELPLDVCMITHAQISVVVGTDQRTFPTIDAFLRWLDAVHQQVVRQGGSLRITIWQDPAAHPADLALRERIGESSAGPPRVAIHGEPRHREGGAMRIDPTLITAIRETPCGRLHSNNARWHWNCPQCNWHLVAYWHEHVTPEVLAEDARCGMCRHAARRVTTEPATAEPSPRTERP